MRGKLGRWWWIALAVVPVLAFGGGVAFAENYLRPAHPDNPTSQRGCVIRFDTLSSSGASVVPRIHANSTHMCVGVTSVAADWNTGALVVRNSGGPGMVVSISVSPDETFTKRGISCGASGGGVETRIFCYDRAGAAVPAYSKKLYDPYANLWLTWTMWQE